MNLTAGMPTEWSILFSAEYCLKPPVRAAPPVATTRSLASDATY